MRALKFILDFSDEDMKRQLAYHHSHRLLHVKYFFLLLGGFYTGTMLYYLNWKINVEEKKMV